MGVLPFGLVGLFLIVCLAGSGLGQFPISQLVVVIYVIIVGVFNAIGFDPDEQKKQQEDWYKPDKKFAKFSIIVGFIALFIITPTSTKLVMVGMGILIFVGYLDNKNRSISTNTITFYSAKNPNIIICNSISILEINLDNSGNRLDKIDILFLFEMKSNPKNNFEVSHFVDTLFANNSNPVEVMVNGKDPGIYFISMFTKHHNSKKFTQQKGKSILVVNSDEKINVKEVEKNTIKTTQDAFNFMITNAINKKTT
jgi:hypothetical protein